MGVNCKTFIPNGVCLHQEIYILAEAALLFLAIFRMSMRILLF